MRFTKCENVMEDPRKNNLKSLWCYPLTPIQNNLENSVKCNTPSRSLTLSDDISLTTPDSSIFKTDRIMMEDDFEMMLTPSDVSEPATNYSDITSVFDSYPSNRRRENRQSIVSFEVGKRKIEFPMSEPMAQIHPVLRAISSESSSGSTSPGGSDSSMSLSPIEYNMESHQSVFLPPRPATSSSCKKSDIKKLPLCPDLKEHHLVQSHDKYMKKAEIKDDVTSSDLNSIGYVDFSDVSDEVINDETTEMLTGTHASGKQVQLYLPIQKYNQSRQTFPKTLMQILSNENLEGIIQWLPHGRAFVVKNPSALESHVLPNFFKSKLYKSFLRQLSIWEFLRLGALPKKGQNKNCVFYHPLFLRGKEDLTKRMYYVKIKSDKKKVSNNGAIEDPKFELFSIMSKPAKSAAMDQSCKNPSSSPFLSSQPKDNGLGRPIFAPTVAVKMQYMAAQNKYNCPAQYATFSQNHS